VTIGSVIHWYHTFNVQLYFGYKENASEDVFQALIDSVLNKFSDLRSLGGWNSERPLSLLSIQPAYLNKVRVDMATFTLTIIDYQSGIVPS
jgi:hypothetical protein